MPSSETPNLHLTKPGHFEQEDIWDYTMNTNLDILDAAYASKGATGDTGDKGTTGDTGDKGGKGDTGDKGLSGDPGPIGDDGGMGATGDKGHTGDKGTTGDMGKGPTGDKGETGDKGATGDMGAVGVTGETGSVIIVGGSPAVAAPGFIFDQNTGNVAFPNNIDVRSIRISELTEGFYVDFSVNPHGAKLAIVNVQETILDGDLTVESGKCYSQSFIPNWTEMPVNTAQNALSVSSYSLFFCPATGGCDEYTLSGFANGEPGQTVRIVKFSNSVMLTIENNAAGATQKIFTRSGGHVLIFGGGITLVCYGNAWYELHGNNDGG